MAIARSSSHPESPGEGEVALADKVAFLSRCEAYPDAEGLVERRETHMSWVFLAGRRVYKLKKPIDYAIRDGRQLRVREWLCREEVRLNRRLAGKVYLGVVPLCMRPRGRLVLGAGGRIVDWLVVMQRLPEFAMLDAAIARGRVTPTQVARVAKRLADFYRSLAPEKMAPEAYIAQLAREQAKSRDMLMDPRFDLPAEQMEAVFSRLEHMLSEAPDLLAQRVSEGRIVEGHGDLRPEHVCLCRPPVIIDCLEFSRDLRRVDPFDELSFLGMECSRLGAPWIGEALIHYCTQALEDHPPGALLAFHATYRACLRARLALAHLLDPHPPRPEPWLALARTYLLEAEKASVNLPSPATR